MKINQFFIMDFDSTFIQVEALEELAAISLKGNSDKNEILNQIRELTDSGLEGKISFTESLDKRIKLLDAKKLHL